MPNRVAMFGLAFDAVTLDEAVLRIDRLARSERGQLVVTPNVDFVVRADADPAFRRICAASPLVLADGMPVVWASRLLRRPLPERVAGSDLFPALCAHAAEHGLSVYFLGAREGVAARAAELLRAEHPGLDVRGTDAPPFGFDRDPDLTAAAIARVRAAAPDILFIGLGSPKQETWYDAHRDALGVGVAIGVGASFDFVAGTARRAPRWMQRIGLEWLHRLLHEPRRLARRYLREDPRFVRLLLREWRRGRHAPHAGDDA